MICKDIIAVELTKYLEALKRNLNNIHSIDGIRANSQRIYTDQSQGTNFNFLLSDVCKSWPLPKDEGVFLNKWVKKLGIGEQIKINRIKGIATEISIVKDGIETDLIDLGYGVTQLLPVLLYICSKLEHKKDTFVYDFVKPGKIGLLNGPLLFIEEPESNLHPKLQSLLADFFLDAAKYFHVTLLIETHSEYLIRRLQVLTAAGEVGPSESVIYYLNGERKADEENLVKKININPDGSLTNDFGPGFIDEATNWKMELMRLKNAQLQNLN